MTTEESLHRYRDAELWPGEEALAAMLENQFGAFAAVRQAIPDIAAAVTQAAARLGNTGRLIYAGAGASGRLAVQDGVELFPTFGWPRERLCYLLAGGVHALTQSMEGAEDDWDAGLAAAAACSPGPQDVAITVAASGTTRFTRAVQSHVRAAGGLTIALANNPASALLLEAEHPIALATGAEFLAGSTRMTAGTAQKIALNLFSTRLMTELGRVYSGRMVRVVPSNAKLMERSKRIIAELTGASADRVASAWAETGDIRLAVLMLDGHDRVAAEFRLAAAAGNLRHARGG